jgi:hypothetical protein
MSTATTWCAPGPLGPAVALPRATGRSRRTVTSSSSDGASLRPRSNRPSSTCTRPSILKLLAGQAQVEHAAGDQLPVDAAQHAKALGLEPEPRPACRPAGHGR